MLSFLTDLPVRDACCDHLREHDSQNVGKVCVKGARVVGPGHWLPLWLEDMGEHSFGGLGWQ